MGKRSMGVTAIAFGTVMVAIYSQHAAIALLATGGAFMPGGQLHALVTLVTGSVFLGVAGVAYVSTLGLWFRRAWAWSAAMAVYVSLVGANLALSVLAGNYVSAVLPSVGAIIAVVYLQRATVREEILGPAKPVTAAVPTTDALEAAHPVH